jgi:hypothetical protein
LFRHGVAVPLIIWIVGPILIVAGLISMIRRGVLLGVFLVVLRVFRGSLRLF